MGGNNDLIMATSRGGGIISRMGKHAFHGSLYNTLMK